LKEALRRGKKAPHDDQQLQGWYDLAEECNVDATITQSRGLGSFVSDVVDEHRGTKSGPMALGL
jgi:hypothetical protein